MQSTVEKRAAGSPTQVQFLYKHRNGRYYVRAFAGGKEKWTNIEINPLPLQIRSGVSPEGAQIEGLPSVGVQARR